MEFDHIIIRYGELSTKKRNRKSFVDKMKSHIRWAIKDLKHAKVTSSRDRMYVLLNGEDHLEVIQRIKGVYGIQSLSPALKIGRDIEEVKTAALYYFEQLSKRPETFKITTRRSDKDYPYDTNEMNHLIGGHLLINNDGHLKVDVKNPDFNLRIEIRREAVYLTGEIIEGAGGLPFGSSGKAMLMLSGGIDSPVAGFLSMKRGLEVECIHFYSPPFTSERSKQKVIDLAHKLAEVNGTIKLHIVPFTDIQVLIQKQIPENYTMTSTRRLMLRIADAIREKNEGMAIITGESLGQVASQTLESMFAINEVTNTPILRPLITVDKTEIIAMAREMETLEISNQPFEDCCTVFTPASPKTKPRREKVNYYEGFVDFEPMIEKAVQDTETLRISGEKQDNVDETIEDLF
ncbi:tRNA 4-thiouridine(8) synthase ThiI [Peribacillus psychrosaccharolyticus]|uniref:Probable tRNA sulfurtransferase n=1 Tax=Peribacillus psychrosaccharolyticus TaxID=1407 RepID=A0A974NKL7_PERPY|nr:tRNA uracil 4-sulfurtransferase ThiI [Peribacillus psychrosaccharolyticus]MEC2054731.1 tRNA 4-thiouridine(8) synthase ThiI [Peribacillus psychrosaccharolyticus]MED3744042.1 tRNA 4-thiouridine(8) synthase ThiI [Peribacillus psychrosaccharolyticus]QQS99538.1 tRNA 4-thiouridine(8) synthase ThiI [Peribacillus psychrosaccharolyticus]